VTRRGSRPAGIFAKVQQHLVVKNESEILKKRAETLRDEILLHLEKNGEADEKGSLLLNLPEHLLVGGKDYASIKRERRVSTAFDEEAAEALLHTKGLLPQAQKTSVTVTLPSEYAEYFSVAGGQVNIINEYTGEPLGTIPEATFESRTFIDQNEVYVLNQQDKITNDELDALMVETVTWAYKPLVG